MRDDTKDAGTYVHKVRDSTRRYIHDLLSENEKLRGLATSLESENTQLRDERLRLQERLLSAREELDRIKEQEVSLQRKLATIEAEHQRFSQQFEAVEQQNSDLANLYVASYRLHATLDRKEVLGIVQEIIINLIGCEELAIFEVAANDSRLSLVASLGIDPARYQAISLGSGPIGRAGLTGETYLAAPTRKSGTRGSPDETDLTACIPMKLEGRVSGVIALFRLLPQKPRLEALDHELCGLLATHAAVALYCTALHAAAHA
jgi:hypothetical protein